MSFRKTLLAGSIVVIAACQPPADAPVESTGTASITLTNCTQAQFSHRGTRKDFQCGTLSVPENPQDPQGRQIGLNIVRLPAVSASPQPDPIFVLAGGPGQGSTEIVSGVVPWLRLVNRERDVIFVDQRGTGKSNPLDCGEDILPDYSLTPLQVMDLQTQTLQTCLANYDADLRFYTTPYAADDINAVRLALGYPRMNLWGASYGTRLGLEIMRRHGNHVRSAVLDGVAPIGINLPQYVLRDADRSMGLIIGLCEADASCRQNYPDIRQKLPALIEQYDNNPTAITAVHPLRGQEFSLRLDGQSIASLLRLGLYSRDISPTLPLIIANLAQENFGPLLTLLSFSEELNSTISIGLQHTILCAEDVARIKQGDSFDNSLLNLQVIEPVKKICAFWPQGELPSDFFEPIANNTLASKIPTLLLSGELDPVTPPPWGERTAAMLSNSQLIIVPGAHHGVSTLGCMPKIIDQFFSELLEKNIETDCVNHIAPLPPFATPAGPAMQGE